MSIGLLLMHHKTSAYEETMSDYCWYYSLIEMDLEARTIQCSCQQIYSASAKFSSILQHEALIMASGPVDFSSSVVTSELKKSTVCPPNLERFAGLFKPYKVPLKKWVICLIVTVFMTKAITTQVNLFLI